MGTLTMHGVFNIYRLLLEQFDDSPEVSQIRLELAGAPVAPSIVAGPARNL